MMDPKRLRGRMRSEERMTESQVNIDVNELCQYITWQRIKNNNGTDASLEMSSSVTTGSGCAAWMIPVYTLSVALVGLESGWSRRIHYGDGIKQSS